MGKEQGKVRQIYILKNVANNKQFIFVCNKWEELDQTINILVVGRHENPDLRADWTHFGRERFDIDMLWNGMSTRGSIRKQRRLLCKRYQPEYNLDITTAKGSLIAAARDRRAQLSEKELAAPWRPLPVAAIAVLERTQIVQIDDPGWPRLIQLGYDYPREIMRWVEDEQKALDSFM